MRDVVTIGEKDNVLPNMCRYKKEYSAHYKPNARLCEHTPRGYCNREPGCGTTQLDFLQLLAEY